MQTSAENGEFAPSSLPSVLSIPFQPGSVKEGGLVTYLRLLALGQQRGSHPFEVRVSANGLTVVFLETSGSAVEIFLEKDDDDVATSLEIVRLDTGRWWPYAGESSVCLDVCSALKELDDDTEISVPDSLFQFTPEGQERVARYCETGGTDWWKQLIGQDVNR